MNAPRLRLINVLSAVLVSLPAFTAVPFTDPIHDPERSLGDLRRKILFHEDKVRLAREKHRKSQEKRIPHEKLYAIVENKLRILRKEIGRNSARLSNIHLRRDKVEKRLTARYSRMTRESLAMVLARSGGALGAILHADSAADAAGQLARHEYLHARQTAYFSQLVELHRDRRFLGSLLARLEQYDKNLENDYLKTLDTYLGRRREQRERQRLLHAYISDQEKQINLLHGQEQRLLALLHQQRRLPAGEKQPGVVETGEYGKGKFISLRGQLQWPVGGVVHNLFDQPAPGSLVAPWQGVFIQQERGRPVKAISDGRVIYADAFKNMGNLLILDHGEGYMSLYAHNENLRNRTGDWVSRGDIIASTGNAGHGNQVGLYFEIRHHGDPVNPTLWCD